MRTNFQTKDKIMEDKDKDINDHFREFIRKSDENLMKDFNVNKIQFIKDVTSEESLDAVFFLADKKKGEKTPTVIINIRGKEDVSFIKGNQGHIGIAIKCSLGSLGVLIQDLIEAYGDYEYALEKGEQ